MSNDLMQVLDNKNHRGILEKIQYMLLIRSDFPKSL